MEDDLDFDDLFECKIINTSPAQIDESNLKRRLDNLFSKNKKKKPIILPSEEESDESEEEDMPASSSSFDEYFSVEVSKMDDNEIEQQLDMLRKGGSLKDLDKHSKALQRKEARKELITLTRYMKTIFTNDMEWLQEQLTMRKDDWNKFIYNRDEQQFGSTWKLTPIELKPHQVQITNDIKNRVGDWSKPENFFGKGYILMLLQGLGKTPITLDIICHYLNSFKTDARGIMILNINVDSKKQWGMEIFKNTNLPSSRVFIPKTLRNFEIPDPDQFFIVLATYSMFSRADAEVFKNLAKYKWHYIVTDEAQTYRDSTTKTFRNLAKFADQCSPSPFKLTLSGTYIVNTLMDLATQSIWLSPKPYECQTHNLIHDFGNKNWWLKLVKKNEITTEQQEQIVQEYREWFSKYVVHIDTEAEAEILSNFGFQVKRQLIKVDLDQQTLEIYDILGNYFKKYAEKLKTTVQTQQWKDYIMVTILFMCICLNHPGCISDVTIRSSGSKKPESQQQTTEELPNSNQQFLKVWADLGIDASKFGYKYESPKIKTLKNLVLDIFKNHPGDKIIVFSQYASFLYLIDYHLKQSNIGNSILYTGKIKKHQKSENLNIFKTDPNVNILLASTKCGSTSLNITEANHVIHIDLGWNHAEGEQCLSRCARMGQQKKVVYDYTIICPDTIEIWKLYKIDMKWEKQKKWTKGDPEELGNEKLNVSAEDIDRIYTVINGSDIKTKNAAAKSKPNLRSSSNSHEAKQQLADFSDKIFEKYRNVMNYEIKAAERKYQSDMPDLEEQDEPESVTAVATDGQDQEIDYLKNTFGTEFANIVIKKEK